MGRFYAEQKFSDSSGILNPFQIIRRFDFFRYIVFKYVSRHSVYLCA